MRGLELNADTSSVDSSREELHDRRRGKTISRHSLSQPASSLGWIIARLPFDPSTSLEEAGPAARRRRDRRREIPHLALSRLESTEATSFSSTKKMQKAAEPRSAPWSTSSSPPTSKSAKPRCRPSSRRSSKAEKALAQMDRTTKRLHAPRDRQVARSASKGPEARQRRAEQMAERLMLTMEGEKILPPILDVAFRRNPAARKGWDAMTPDTTPRPSAWASSTTKALRLAKNASAKVIEDCMKAAAK